MTVTDRKEQLATQFLRLAKVKSRELAKKMRKCGLVPDVEELESDAYLFLTKAIDSYTEKETKSAEGYFHCGLNRWSSHQLQDRLDSLNKKTRTQTEQIPDLLVADQHTVEAFSYLDEDPLFQEELEKETGGEEHGSELKLLIRFVLEEGWDRKKLIETFGRDHYYRDLRPALARLLGIEVESE